MADDPNTTNIQQQILQTAGFYPPTIYDLLTRESTLQTINDPQATDYLPLTDVVPPPNTQTLPFVIGFIPPPAPTGNLISREASVAQNSNNSPPLTLGAGQNVGPAGDPAGTKHSLSSNGAAFIVGHEGFVTHVYNDYLNLPSIGVGHLIRPGEDFSGGLTQQGAIDLFKADSAGGATYINNVVKVPLNQNQFDALQSIVFGCGHIPKPILDKINAGDYQGAADIWPSQYLGGRQADGTFKVIPGMDIIRQNEVNLFKTPPGSTYQYNPKVLQQPVTGDVNANGSSWNTQGGGDNAQAAALVRDSTVNQSLNTTALGQNFQQKQQSQITVLTQLINQMAQTPPLRMLVNPRSFKNSLEKIIADGNWGRNGPIIEHWGEQLDKIEGAGKLAAFYALDNNPPGNTSSGDQSSTGPGLSRMTRNFSSSYQNFLSLYLIYRNNAAIWTEDFNNAANGAASSPQSLNLAEVGSIYLYYDNILYIGSFDDFTITESDEAPFSLEYNFTFTVRAWFLLDQQQDPLLGWQKPVNGPIANGNAFSGPTIQPQNGQVPTQNDVSQFGPDAGQPSPQQTQFQANAAAEQDAAIRDLVSGGTESTSGQLRAIGL